MEWKYKAKKRGEALAKVIGKLEYFTFGNDGNFINIKEPNAELSTFLEDRQTFINEQSFLNLIYPFVAYFTAPTEEDGDTVIAELQKIDIEMKDKLFQSMGMINNIPLSVKLKSVDTFFETFKIITGEVEKACNAKMKEV